MRSVQRESDWSTRRAQHRAATLEQRGDSVTGTWELVDAAASPGGRAAGLRQLRGTISGNKVSLSTQVEARRSINGDESLQTLTIVYDFSVEGDKLRGTTTVKGSDMASKSPLWQCPRCGHQFVTKNLWHSCVRVPLAAHFRGKPVERKRTWDRWVAIARACGPVKAYAQKTRIVIQARVRFAGAVVRVSYLDAGLWLRRRVEHPRLRRVEDFGRLGYVHHFRLEAPSDIDEPLQKLMQEAYRVGKQDSPRHGDA